MIKRQVLFLIILLIVACFFRFYKITHKGFCAGDTAIYLLEAKWFLTAFKALPDILTGKDLNTIREKIQGIPLRHPKPTHSFFIALFSLFTGGLKDYTADVMAATFGVITILMTYLIGKLFYGEKVGVISALVLAFLPFHIIYSREGLAEQDAAVFLALSIYFYYKNIKTNKCLHFLALAGFFAGICFTCNYRWILAPLLILFYEIIHQFKEGKSVKRISLLCFFISLPLILWQFPYACANYLFTSASEQMPFHSYFQVLFNHVFTQASHTYLFRETGEGVKAFLFYMWKYTSLLCCVFASFGLYFLIKGKEYKNFMIICWLLTPIILFGFFNIAQVPLRTFTIVLVPFALSVGISIEKLGLRKHLKFCIYPALFLLLIPEFILKTFPLLWIKAGFREANMFLEKIGAQKVLTTAGWCTNFYRGFDFIEIFHFNLSVEKLQTLYKRGYKFALVDVHKFFMKKKKGESGHFRGREFKPSEKPKILEAIEKRCKPVYIAHDTRGLYLSHWLEGGGELSKTLKFYHKTPFHEKFGIKIYDLTQFFNQEVVNG